MYIIESQPTILNIFQKLLPSPSLIIQDRWFIDPNNMVHCNV